MKKKKLEDNPFIVYLILNAIIFFLVLKTTFSFLLTSFVLALFNLYLLIRYIYKKLGKLESFDSLIEKVLNIFEKTEKRIKHFFVENRVTVFIASSFTKLNRHLIKINIVVRYFIIKFLQLIFFVIEFATGSFNIWIIVLSLVLIKVVIEAIKFNDFKDTAIELIVWIIITGCSIVQLGYLIL
ncbi:hypothetical protein DY037_01455 [Apilactobacillus micheneri]|uniref:hypothetical protein n=1 Tax=Apilactobacillus micheneri TaxID=1899430 RepID=UPI0011294D5E|nr:hypothetical protein [Apilactobacillus micheneri]TPR39112.1 hypothetical protein DY119_05475 [Apilactobacillus micheneri]TPR50643.1 hypothetical protein DY037_01455 [Apilactobacillus micheneri]